MQCSWLDHLDVESESHSGGTLLQHLEGTASLLSIWGASSALIRAGRYHTLYGTSTYRAGSLPEAARGAVALTIGEEAERLVFLYSHKSSYWFQRFVVDAKIIGSSVPLPLEDGRLEWVTASELCALAALTLANAVDQSPRLDFFSTDEPYLLLLVESARQVLPTLPACPVMYRVDAANRAPEILELADLFSWRSSEQVRFVTSRFDRIAFRACRRLLERIEGSDDCFYPVAFLWEKLEPDIKWRVALHPVLLSVSLYRHRWKAGSNRAVIEIVERACGLRSDLPLGVLDGPFGLEFEFDGRYSSVWGDGDHTADAEPLAPSAREFCQLATTSAMTALADASPVARDLFFQSVRSVSFRCTPSASGFGGSSSWPHMPGLIGLLCAPEGLETSGRLVSAILHEAIHSYLYMVEAEFPFSADVNRLRGWTARSPWSGRELPIASFVHAVFVWFGLAQFWKAALGAEAFPDAAVEFEHAVAGFAGPDFEREISSLAGRVRPDVLEVFDTLPAQVARR